MVRVSSSQRVDIETPCPVRIYMENGLELQLDPVREGLNAKAIYHQHSWLGPPREILFDAQSPWNNVFTPECSFHERIGWLQRLPARPREQAAGARHIDMSECDLVFLNFGIVQLGVVRVGGLGLTISISGTEPRDPGKRVNVLLPQTRAGDVSENICALVRLSEVRFGSLPAWRRILLEMSTDLSLVLHVLEDVISHALAAARRTLKRKLT